MQLLRVFLFLVVAILAGASPVWAQGAEPGAAPADGDKRDVARDAYNSGKTAADAGDYPAAYEHFKLAHNLMPTPHTGYWLAFCVDQMGNMQAAVDAYQAFLADPKKKDAGKERVDAAKKRVKELTAQIAENKKVARAEYGSAKAAVGAGDFAGAYDHFKKAHELLPTAHTQYWMAFCLDRQGKEQEALDAYQEFLAHPDRNKVGNEQLANAESRAKVLKSKAQAAAAPPPPPTSIQGGTAADIGTPTVMGMGELSRAVDDLQAEIRKSHHQLKLLSDTVLAGGSSAGRAQIRFLNELSGAFRVTEVVFVLDGAIQYKRRDTSGSLADQQEIPIYTGSIPAGSHTVQILLKLQGEGHGVFSYLRGYTFEVKSTHSFKVPPGRTMQLDVVAWERGGATTPLDQRPALRFNAKVTTGMGQPASRPAAQ